MLIEFTIDCDLANRKRVYAGVVYDIEELGMTREEAGILIARGIAKESI